MYKKCAAKLQKIVLNTKEKQKKNNNSLFFCNFAGDLATISGGYRVINKKEIAIKMGFFSNLFGKKNTGADQPSQMENYMTLVRVYFQAAIAESAGITNLAMLPDLRMFKSTLKVPTVNNKLGVGERRQCRKMMQGLYKTSDGFFTEIDASVKKNCRKMQDVQTYLVQFQNLTQNLMMLTGNLMKFKLRLPSIFKKAIYTMTEKTITDIFHKNEFDDPGVMKTVVAIRQVDKRLGFSEKWVTDFVYQVVMLAKKEPRQNLDEK